MVLAAVADGMGGLAQGQQASQSAIEVLESADLQTEDIQGYLNDLVVRANQAVRQKARDGGTTLSAILVKGSQLNIAHVGDSRIYLIRRGIICQLSEDHSMVGMLIASGQLSLEASFNHPDRSVLLRSLGSKPVISAEYIQTLDRYGQADSLRLADQDILLLCSDGVWDLVNPNELADIFTISKSSLQSAVDQVIAEVLNRGANDNATLIALKFNLFDA